MDEESRHAISSRVNRHLVHNVLYMAYTEGQEVIHMDDDCISVIEEHHSRMLFLYGRTDRYTPLPFYEELKERFPEGLIELAPEGVEHAFVLQNMEIVAERVCRIIKEWTGV